MTTIIIIVIVTILVLFIIFDFIVKLAPLLFFVDLFHFILILILIVFGFIWFMGLLLN